MHIITTTRLAVLAFVVGSIGSTFGAYQTISLVSTPPQEASAQIIDLSEVRREHDRFEKEIGQMHDDIRSNRELILALKDQAVTKSTTDTSVMIVLTILSGWIVKNTQRPKIQPS